MAAVITLAEFLRARIEQDPERVSNLSEAPIGFVVWAHSGHVDQWCSELLGSPTSPDECHTLRSLAVEYADHPDFREEWRR